MVIGRMASRRQFFVWLGVVPLCLVVMLGGCRREPPGAIARGKASYKGKTLDKGSIVFYPASSRMLSHAKILADGRFKLENQVGNERIEPGKYTAVILADNTEIAAMKEDPLFPVQPTVPF